MTLQTTPLRQRMIDDMKVRNMSASTQAAYVRAVKNFAAFHGRSPDKLNFEDVRTYQLHLTSRGLQRDLQPDHLRAALLLRVTLGKPEAKTALPLAGAPIGCRLYCRRRSRSFFSTRSTMSATAPRSPRSMLPGCGCRRRWR